MKKINHLSLITTVFEKSRSSKLAPSIFMLLDSELAVLSSFFKLSKQQALFMAIVFNLNYKGSYVGFQDLIEYFECVPSRLLEFSNDFEEICIKRIFIKKKSSSDVNLAFIGDTFSISRSVSDIILDKKSSTTNEIEKSVSEYSLINNVFNLASLRNEGSLSTNDLFKLTRDKISKNLHFPIIKMVSDLKLNDSDQYFYTYLLWVTLDCEESVDVKSFADLVFDNLEERVIFLQSIASQKNDLFRLKLIENAETFFFKGGEIKLSDSSSDMLSKLNINIPRLGEKKISIIKSDDIFMKELFFNDKEQVQINILSSMLEINNLNEIQKRLQKSGQTTGIAILFHGFPGTGKTESVYQIARMSGRDVIKVDISQARSKWYGESEKIIKNIFSNYYSFISNCVKTPILLFNEADAILSTRTIGVSSKIEKAENNMQNIILEELENFKGILVATTNIVANLDKAFERRFLYKIEFCKPNLDVKSKIWNSKFPQLNKSQCNLLSTKFNFTGGQINNISKKIEIEEILFGKDLGFDAILQFCNSEEITTVLSNKIGFQKKSHLY